eukprot:4066426-Ditylum_brightwellii.AAC.2
MESHDKVKDDDNIGIIGLIFWLVSLSSFVLVNNFVGPWPEELIDAIPEPTCLLVHYIGGKLINIVPCLHIKLLPH